MASKLEFVEYAADQMGAAESSGRIWRRGVPITGLSRIF